MLSLPKGLQKMLRQAQHEHRTKLNAHAKFAKGSNIYRRIQKLIFIHLLGNERTSFQLLF